MNIGISANMNRNAYGRWGEERYKKMKEHGFSSIDFNMMHTDSIVYTASQGESDAILLHEKKLAEEAGIEISQVHGPWRWPAKDFSKEDRNERMEKMKKSIRATALMGCKNWVIHPIMPYGVAEINTENSGKTWDINLEFMRELLKTAKEYDVTICLENMPMLEFSLAKPSDILRFVRTINDKNFKICLDTGHVSVFSELSLGAVVRELGDEIRVLHVHDNTNSLDLHLMPLLGVIDWQDFSKALRDINFKGSFSLECIPPIKLSDNIFEEMCIMYCKIANEIIESGMLCGNGHIALAEE